MKKLMILLIILTHFWLINPYHGMTKKANIPSSSFIHPKVTTLSEEIILDGLLLPKNISPIYILDELPIEKIYVSDGDFVTKGQCLLTYRTDELKEKKETIRKQIQILTSQKHSAPKKQKKNVRHPLLTFFHSSDKQVEVLEQEWDEWKNHASNIQLAQLHTELKKIAFLEQHKQVIAPFSGQIVFQTGSSRKPPEISGKTPIFSLVNTEHLQGCFYANIYQLPDLHIGDSIDMHWNGARQNYTGKITKIHSVPKEGTQQYEIHADLSFADKNLYIGMIGTGYVAVTTHPHALTIPKKCVQFEGNQCFVYTVQNHKIKKAVIQVGLTTPASVEVISGIQAKDWILQDHLDEVYEGQQIKE